MSRELVYNLGYHGAMIKLCRVSQDFNQRVSVNERTEPRYSPSTTESPLRNIFGMKRSLFTGFRFLLLG